MAKKENLSYQAAMTELESIMKLLEAGQLDVDDMVKQVQRASELISFCQQKLSKTEEAIAAIFKEDNES
ncbi:MAG: exodeoxyribonuclease VII small subunit [Bacteroidales bacterium]|nr:exodeoxyribonuclease VII small subunit [Bacteroidales bacterium]